MSSRQVQLPLKTPGNRCRPYRAPHTDPVRHAETPACTSGPLQSPGWDAWKHETPKRTRTRGEPPGSSQTPSPREHQETLETCQPGSPQTPALSIASAAAFPAVETLGREAILSPSRCLSSGAIRLIFPDAETAPPSSGGKQRRNDVSPAASPA